uniref:Major facilitator superfamily (MFS) profile domain-containing protein n=1 Tax=Arion vulgaris TaxID=1028688 RepID=A0A0B7AJA2_9EUPU
MFGQSCILGGCLAEIVFFLYKTGEAMLDAAVRPFVVVAVCQDMTRDLVIVAKDWTSRIELFQNGSLDPCDFLDEFPTLQTEIHSRAATFLMIYRILVNVPAIILSLFCGAWSDQTGRKLPMMVPSIGSILAVLLYMAGVIMTQHTLLIIMVGALVQGLLGKSSVITMAVNSYVSDTTDMDDRTRKLGKLLAMNFFGLFVGSLLAGALQDIFNLQVLFVVVALFHAVSVLTVVLCVEESVTMKLPLEDGDPQTRTALFSFQGLKESVQTLVKSRECGKRTLVLSAFLAMFLNQTCKVGEQDITVLFVQRPPLSWQPSGYGYLLSVDYAVMGLCLLLLLPVLSTFLHVSDIIIILMGLACKLVRTLWAGFCTETWMVYVSVVIGAMAGVITSALRSILSKSVNDHELGKIFALAASAETAAKLLGSVAFINIYSATVMIWPGVAYACAGIVYLLLAALMVWLHKQEKIGFTKNNTTCTINGAACQDAIPDIPCVREPEAETGEKEVRSLLPLSDSFVVVPASTP